MSAECSPGVTLPTDLFTQLVNNQKITLIKLSAECSDSCTQPTILLSYWDYDKTSDKKLFLKTVILLGSSTKIEIIFQKSINFGE